MVAAAVAARMVSDDFNRAGGFAPPDLPSPHPGEFAGELIVVQQCSGFKVRLTCSLRGQNSSSK